MGGKGVGAKIRRLNKGKKPHESVFDPDELPEGSIIAVDISTMLVPFVKSDEGAAQQTAMPTQSVTSVQDKLELIYIKKAAPLHYKMLCVVDGNFHFKDQVVRHQRNKLAILSTRKLQSARSDNVLIKELITQVRRSEKGIAKVTCDVVANVVQWAQRRPGITAVSY